MLSNNKQQQPHRAAPLLIHTWPSVNCLKLDGRQCVVLLLPTLLTAPLSLPLHAGSAKFHVEWTGVAEILGGLGLCLGALPFSAIPSWLSPASALGLFLLTAVVTPSNIYMYTHNAPGPVPESVAPGALPWQGHLTRGLMQVLLLSTLWGIATASS